MAAPSSLTLNYDALLTTTLFNYRAQMADNVSTSNALFFLLKKRGGNAWRALDGGDRVQYPLMYALGSPHFYAGLDTLSTDAIDGISSAFFNWAQMAVPITISGIEEAKNSGEAALLSLMDAKVQQAEMGLIEFFGKALNRGNLPNGGAATSAFVDPLTAATGFDPLPALVSGTPSTTPSTVGNISATTNTWWRNQATDSAATTYAGFLKELDQLYNNCSKGPGGTPDIVLSTQGTFELYKAALRSQNRYTEQVRADFPFAHVLFYGQPWTWDEFVIDVKNGTIAITKGSVFMLNTKFWGVSFLRGKDFAPGPFMKPVNQDARTAQILVYLSVGVSNRRKHGVLMDVDETLTS